jgi:excisionase family DNA binding protein
VTEGLLTARELAELLGMSRDWVFDRWEAGDLPGFRIGGGARGPVRFRLSEVEAVLETWRRGPAVPERRLEVVG